MHVKKELRDLGIVAPAADECSGATKDHYLTVSVHYERGGTIEEKILHARALYTSQPEKGIDEELLLWTM